MTALVLRACLVVLVVLGCAAWCARVLASPARPEIVVVSGAEYGATVTQLFQAVVHARLPEVRVRYVPESEWQRRPATAAAPDLVCRLDTSEASEWRLRLEYQGTAWTRSIEGGLSRDAAAVEAAALMAAHTSVALLTQDAASAVPGQPPELEAWSAAPVEVAPAAAIDDVTPRNARPAPPPAATPASARQRRDARHDDFWWLALGAAYRGQTYAPDHPWSHGTRLSLLTQLPGRLCAALGATFVEPTHVDSEFGSFTLRRQQGELSLGWCFRWDRWGLRPRGGLLVEVARRTDATAAPGVGASTDRQQVGWAGVTAIEGRWSVVERVHLWLGLGAAYFLEQQEFVAAGVPEPVLAPYRVRLSLDFGLELGLF